MLLWAAIALESALVMLGFVYSPLLWVAIPSFMLLLRRRELGAWGSLVFFGLQTIRFEKGGALVWPPGTSVGINFELVGNATHTLDLGISSIVLAIVSAAVIVQFSEEKRVAASPEVVSLLPPDTSLERTRDR
jgi:hypothetical protein